METIKIAFADMWEPFEKEDFITPILKTKYNVVIDQKNPDVLFHSIFNRMSQTPKYKCKKVLILAENWRPSRFNSDYSISFDPHSETNFRLPLWQIYLLLWPELKDQLYNRLNHKEFKHFGAFTVSNPSNQKRNNDYDILKEYKRVESYGKVRRTSFKLDRLSQGVYWRDAKLKFFTDNPHKFMMAYENTSYPYYCTEKLMDSFLVGSIPIYWGDPKVVEDWNEKAFINANDPRWMQEVRRTDGNIGLFEKKYNESVFTEEQKNKLEENLESFKDWLLNIVNVN